MVMIGNRASDRDLNSCCGKVSNSLCYVSCSSDSFIAQQFYSILTFNIQQLVNCVLMRGDFQVKQYYT